MGINGNVHADLLAKESLGLETISVALCPSMSEICQIINFKFNEIWRESWSRLPTGVTAFKPEPDDCHYTDLPRRQQVAISRIRLNTTVLTHKHLFSNTHGNLCINCDEPVTLEHIFIYCPMFSTSRHHLELACISIDHPLTIETILSPQFPYQDIIKFLESSNLLHQI